MPSRARITAPLIAADPVAVSPEPLAMPTALTAPAIVAEPVLVTPALPSAMQPELTGLRAHSTVLPSSPAAGPGAVVKPMLSGV
jgi:hypothetical protein